MGSAEGRRGVGTAFELVTRIGLVVVLLAQAAAIVLAEPWREGHVLVTISRGHGVTVGDLPALPLLVAAVVTAVCTFRWRWSEAFTAT